MPHYSDGTEAKVGDLVFGKSHGGREPVAGYVVDINPTAADKCNMHVAVLRPIVDPSKMYGTYFTFGAGNGPLLYATACAELANCDQFTLLHRVEAPVPETATA
jgi:hypothetical protein